MDRINYEDIKMKIIRHGSLFSGIGGFDLASEWMGWENVMHCEWNEFGQKILKHYWPNATSYGDITKTDFTIHRGQIDILTGGFPCQPYSTAGKRLGTEDDRHLWPEMLRAIREIQPRFVVGENVSGLLSWNEGLVFNEVQTDLEAEGYEVQPVLLPACGVNAPHRRDRVWFVSRLISNTSSDGQQRNKESKEGCNSQRCGVSLNESDTLCLGGTTTNTQGPYEQRDRLCKEHQERKAGRSCSGLNKQGVATNANEKRLSKKRGPAKLGRFGFSINNTQNNESTWQNFPTQSPIRNGDDGLSSRLDGITFPKWRNESIKAGGNAIVPQVAYQIFKAIEEISYNVNPTES